MAFLLPFVPALTLVTDLLLTLFVMLSGSLKLNSNVSNTLLHFCFCFFLEGQKCFGLDKQRRMERKQFLCSFNWCSNICGQQTPIAKKKKKPLYCPRRYHLWQLSLGDEETWCEYNLFTGVHTTYLLELEWICGLFSQLIRYTVRAWDLGRSTQWERGLNSGKEGPAVGGICRWKISNISRYWCTVLHLQFQMCSSCKCVWSKNCYRLI